MMRTRLRWYLTAVLVACGSAVSHAQELRVFFGNLHSHTSYSDGSATPEDAYRHARDVGLDFVAITEHNHAQAGRIANDPSLYSGSTSVSLISTAQRHTQDGEFIALYGQEFSSISSGNHVNVLDVPTVIDVPNGAYDQLLQNWLPNHPDSTGQQAILLLNHPDTPSSPNAREYGRDDFASAELWVNTLDGVARLINIINGPSHTEGTNLPPGQPSEGEFQRYLRFGFHVAPTADQDNHKENWGDATNARTGIVATMLTKAAILSALRARNVYATEDRNRAVIVRINNHLIGSRIQGGAVPTASSNLDIRVQIRDPDEPTAQYEVQVFAGTIGGDLADLVGVATQQGDGEVQITSVPYAGGPQYFYLKIIQSHDDDEGQDRAWTAPVWFEPSANTPIPSGTATLSLVVDRVKEEAAITNTGGQPVTLTGWTLRSVQGDQRFTFPTFVLSSGATVVVTSGPMGRQNPPAFLRWSTNYIWNNSSDPAELRDAAGNMVAQVP